MFEDDTYRDVIKRLAVDYAAAKKDVAQKEGDLAEAKKRLKDLVYKLYGAMTDAGMESTKLDNGLSPSVSTNRRYYQQAGKTKDDVMDFLKDNGLGHIIKEDVHFNTLQSALKEWEGQGNELPIELFNIIDEPTARMGGISKFNAKE